MGVLRMIKLFGWEARVSEQIGEKRAAEIKLVWKREILDLSNVCLASVASSVSLCEAYVSLCTATLFLSFTWSSHTQSM